jgi:hypothetical protein
MNIFRVFLFHHNTPINIQYKSLHSLQQLLEPNFKNSVKNPRTELRKAIIKLKREEEEEEEEEEGEAQTSEGS